MAYPLLLALAAMLVLRIYLGPTALHDDLKIYWVWSDQFTAALARGTLYPRWMPASDAGLGAPVFYFYPPLAFYLAASFSLLGLSVYASLVASFGVAFAVSGIGCWHWLKGRSNHPLLGAAFFMAAPYHVFNYTDRGVLAESAAVALLPLVAIGLRRIAEGRGGGVLTAVAYAAMIGTHLPLALLVSVFLITPYAVVHRSHLKEFACSIILAIGLAAIYLVPALALERYHDVEQLYRVASLRTDYWSLFSGNWGNPVYSFTFAAIAVTLIAAAWLALICHDRWAMLAVAIVIVVAGVIPFFWSLPLLRDVQFPFRTLAIAEFSLATALARLPRDPGAALAPAALPLALSIIALLGFQFPSGDVRRLQQMHPDVYEYLPKGVIKPGQTNASLSQVLAPRIPPPRIPGMIVEPHFYFPAWSCGREEPRTQLLLHDAACRPHIIWTLAERVGAAISATAALLLALLALGRRRSLSASQELLIRP